MTEIKNDNNKNGEGISFRNSEKTLPQKKNGGSASAAATASKAASNSSTSRASSNPSPYVAPAANTNDPSPTDSSVKTPSKAAMSNNSSTNSANNGGTARVGGLFNYLLARRKNNNSSDAISSNVAVNVGTNDGNVNSTTPMSGQRSSRMKYHRFANAGGSYYFGSYDSLSDSDDDDNDNNAKNAPLFGVLARKVVPASAAADTINSTSHQDASANDIPRQSLLAKFQKKQNVSIQNQHHHEQETSTAPYSVSSLVSQVTEVSKTARQTVDHATEWIYATSLPSFPSSSNDADGDARNGTEHKDNYNGWKSWVLAPSSISSSLSSLVSSTMSSISSYNPFSSDDRSNNNGSDPLGNKGNTNTNNSSINPITTSMKDAFLPKLASRFDLLWATKHRNPYLSSQHDYFYAPAGNTLSSYLNPLNWIGAASSYGDDHLLDGVHGGDGNVVIGGDYSNNHIEEEEVTQQGPKGRVLTKQKSKQWRRRNHERKRKRTNTPSEASVQTVKNLLLLVQHQVVMDSKLQSGNRKNSSLSFASSSSSFSEEKESKDLPQLPTLPSSPKISSLTPFPDIGLPSSEDCTTCIDNNATAQITKVNRSMKSSSDQHQHLQHEPSQIDEKPSYDSFSSYGPSPLSSPARLASPIHSPAQHQPEEDFSHVQQSSNRHNRKYGRHKNDPSDRATPNSAIHAEMAARLSEGILRAYRDLALDEATELHSALHFWTKRWELPLLGWVEAGPTVWFSQEGYSPYDAGRKVSQIQAVLARRCAAIGEMQMHLWRAQWQRGVAEWGMLGGGNGGEWAAVVGGDGAMSAAYEEDLKSSSGSSSRSAMKIFNHSSVVGTNVSNSRGGQIVVDEDALATWSIDAMRVVRDQLYRASSGINELPFVSHWPREVSHFRGNVDVTTTFNDENMSSTRFFDLPTWATENSWALSDASRAAADKAFANIGGNGTVGTSTSHPATPARQKISSIATTTTTKGKSNTHSSITISDLASMSNEVAALLESIEINLEEQKIRRLDRLRPPSRLRRNWYMVALGVPTATLLLYKLTKRHGWFYLLNKLISKLSDICREHVSEPMNSIYQELFSNTVRDVTDRKARVHAVESLKKMIRSWLDESMPKMPLEEKIRLSNEMDISLIEQSKEEAIKHIYEINSVVRMSLIEMQFIKKELMNALVSMDELMGSNEINMQIAAMTPAVILLMAIRRSFHLLFYACFQVGKSREEIYSSFRQTILDIERLLVMRDNPPPLPPTLPWGSTRPPNVNTTDVADPSCITQHPNSQTLSADDLGMVLLHIHECRNVLWQSRRRFRPDVLRNVSEDLAELVGERGAVSVSQQLKIISRMSRTYPFLRANSGIPFGPWR